MKENQSLYLGPGTAGKKNIRLIVALMQLFSRFFPTSACSECVRFSLTVQGEAAENIVCSLVQLTYDIIKYIYIHIHINNRAILLRTYLHLVQ